MVDAVQIGKRIRELRKGQGLKQRELAMILMMSQSTYSKKENGWLAFNARECVILSNYFRVSIDYLYTGKGGEFA